MENTRLAGPVTSVTRPPRLSSRRPGDFTLKLHLHNFCTAWLHQNSFFRMFRTSFSSLEGMSISPSSGTDVGGMQMAPQMNERPVLRIMTPSIGETLSAPRTSNMTSEVDSIRTSLRNVQDIFFSVGGYVNFTLVWNRMLGVCR